jgi:hypothetical protein
MCEINFASVYVFPDSVFSDPFYRSTSYTCTKEAYKLEVAPIVNGDFTRLKATSFDVLPCSWFGLEYANCPNFQEQPGALQTWTFYVGSHNPNFQSNTITMIADYEEYLNNAGEWTPEPVGESTIARVTCDVQKESKYLICNGEFDLKRDNIGGHFDAAFTYSGIWVKDLDDCDKCDPTDSD